MRSKTIFNGYNNEFPSLGTDLKTQRVLDGPISQHLTNRTKPSVFKSNHNLVNKFRHPFSLNEKENFRTNPNLDFAHKTPTGGFRKEKRTMFSSEFFPSLKNKELMKTTNVFDTDFVF